MLQQTTLCSRHLTRALCTSSTATSPPAEQHVVKTIAREAHAAEALATQMLATQAKLLPHRPDAGWFADKEQSSLEAAEHLVVDQHARPSLLLGVLRAGGAALGLAAAVAPKRFQAAIAGGVQDALTEQFNEHLRTLHETGGGLPEVDEVRKVVRGLRDMERAPEGAPQAPDLVTLTQRADKLAPEELVAGAVKAACLGAIALTSKV